MVKRPTIEDLAREAGVSVATVDRVLNRRLPVKEDTALRVVSAAEAIGYHAAGLLKRRLTEAPRRTLGFLLQKKHDAFYQNFGAALMKSVRECREIDGKSIIEHVGELVPAAIAEKIRELSVKADVIAVVAVDHPMVHQAVEEAVAKGRKVFTLLSDLNTAQRSCYLAVDSRKAGRTAGWAIARLSHEPGKVGILVGSHRYLSHEIAEMSFRSYMREHAPGFQLLEPIINLDDERIAHEAVIQMLSGTPDLVGIYAAGGGQEGLVRALREAGRGRNVVAVCNELTPVTRAALIDGVIDMALDTPVEAMSAKAVALMAKAAVSPDSGIPQQILFPAQVCIAENV